MSFTHNFCEIHQNDVSNALKMMPNFNHKFVVITQSTTMKEMEKHQETFL